MLAKIKYADIRGNVLTGTVNDKEETFLMRVTVDKDNIVDAITKLGSHKNVVAFDYYGEVDGLVNLPATQKPVILHKSIEGVDVNLDMFLLSVPAGIRVALKVPNNYCDMRSIIDASKKYPNVTFCGGNLIRLPGASIGCIKQCDLVKKVAESKIPLVCKGCSCIIPNVCYEDIEEPTFTTEAVKERKTATQSNEVKPSTKSSGTTAVSKKKKAVNSLASLFADAGLGY